MRPRHWVKNAFVVAPILFSGRFVEAAAWVQCLAAAAAFCLFASSIYLINDVCDRRQDRAHPVKSRRAIASGRLPAAVAVAAAIAMAAVGMALCAVMVALGVSGEVQALAYDMPQPLGGAGLLVWAGCYVLGNLLYSIWLKNRAIVDVLVVALGFVMRAMAGAAAIAVPTSPWLVVCTLTLCLFIALAKRRSELAEMPAGQAASARKAHLGYEPEVIEHMLAVSAGLAILTYSLYCLAPRTVGNVGSGHMVWTIPLVIYGTFRYYRLTGKAKDSDIVSVLFADRIMWLVLAAYAVLAALIMKFGSNPAVRDILDV